MRSPLFIIFTFSQIFETFIYNNKIMRYFISIQIISIVIDQLLKILMLLSTILRTTLVLELRIERYRIFARRKLRHI